MSITPDHLGGLLAAGLAAPLLLLLLRWPPLARAWNGASLKARMVAAIVLADGLLHLGLVPGHAPEAPGLALSFGLDGMVLAAAFGWTLAVTWWRLPVGLLMVANLVAYTLVVGSGREGADEVGILAKLAELAALGLVLIPHRAHRPWRRGLRWSSAVLAVGLFSALCGTAAWGSELKNAGHVHGGPAAATSAQEMAAAQLELTIAVGISRYQDPAVALADGYRPGKLARNEPTTHWANPRYLTDKYILDPAHPQTLVYANTKHGPMLLGAMFMMPRVGEPGPRPGGPITNWHTHPNICISPLLQITTALSPFGQCPPLTFNIQTSEMIHVWTAPNPNGPYGDLSDAWVKQLVKS